MNKIDPPDSAEDAEDVEELAIVETIDEITDLERSVNDKPSESPLFDECGLRSFRKSSEHTPEPLALVDESLSFIYRNPSFNRLLRAFGYPEASSLLGTLSRSIDTSTARDIHEALVTSGRGHSWKGVVSHKAKDAAAKLTKVHIFPYCPEDDGGEKPRAYWVYLDDVTEENKKFLRDNLDSLLRASLKKDLDTGNHVIRVNLYAKRLCEELYRDPRWPQVDKDFIENIGFLAAMHDVGKIGTPDDILNKEGPLNEFEWAIMKEHTINGAYILSSYPHPMAKEIALSHHEWWNGSGYPYNLEGTMIPLSARIVSVADVYDALRMKRSYKPAHSHEDTVQKIREERGVHFDPDIVDVTLRIGADFERIFAENAD